MWIVANGAENFMGAAILVLQWEAENFFLEEKF